MAKQIKVGYIIFKMFLDETTEDTFPVGVACWDEDLEFWEMKMAPDLVYAEMLTEKIAKWADDRSVPYSQGELLPWTSSFWDAVRDILTTGIIATAPRAASVIGARYLFSKIVDANARQRSSIRWFADKMELKLREHDEKDGWSDCSDEYLLNRLLDEVNELFEAVSTGEGVIEEAADVANFAMMIADNYNIKRDEK